MTIKEMIKLSKEAKEIADNTGRNFKEVLEEMKSAIPTKKAPKLDLSKGIKMTEKEIKKMEMNRKPSTPIKKWEGLTIAEINKMNALENLPSSMR